MKKLLLPALIVAVGAGAAFAGNMAKFDETAYRFDEAQNLCVVTEKMCGEDANNPVCTWTDGVTQLHRIGSSSTSCGQLLYEIQP
ncbi:hypothetical protein SAMN05443633_11293 [Chryseobacterium arachidis]|uniref:NVEALA protein n=2 Tax=Chryseobacterium arachidis TaxID=1416778 RepID=A0A1M5IDF6_9FLAO|nr:MULTISPECIES: DUF6520 family protein [Bacteroidota]QRY55919.1 hypothetical protein JVX97_18040 [Sphingobacterium siyangense]SHG26109.1 hypothetical protein SAMN05443633_11293 [Chryseobacterium arachidis]